MFCKYVTVTGRSRITAAFTGASQRAGQRNDFGADEVWGIILVWCQIYKFSETGACFASRGRFIRYKVCRHSSSLADRWGAKEEDWIRSNSKVRNTVKQFEVPEICDTWLGNCFWNVSSCRTLYFNAELMIIVPFSFLLFIPHSPDPSCQPS